MSTILLIEDNREILENTAEILELAGYDVYTAENGKDGIEKARAKPPDLIISDIMMPILDGFGVLHLAQKNPDLADIPFIFLTAKTERIDFRKGMEMGADDYITKPFNDTELLNAVESRLKKVERLKAQSPAPTTADVQPQGTYNQGLKVLFRNQLLNRYKKKQVVFSEGNHPQYLFYLVSGKVKAFKINDEGKELTVGLYAASDFMGYTALLEESVYNVTAKTLEDSQIALIPLHDFFDLMNKNAGLAQHFIRLLAGNNNQKAEWMVQHAYNSLRKRVANTLLLFKKKYLKPEETDFSIQITREELANLSGTTTESLIRTLSDFKAEGLIEIREKHIEIIAEGRLMNMLN